MTSALAAWSRIHAWLARSAPQVLAALPPGASEHQIAALEAKIGARLPQDARESFSIHDGAGDCWFIAGCELLSLQRASAERDFWLDLDERSNFEGWQTEPGAGVRGGWFRALWLPLTYDGAGDYHCLDLDPAQDGHFGQIIEFWHDADDRNAVAPSFAAWLSAFAYDLEAGAYFVNVDGNGLEWRPRESAQ
jgi:cell wall assembly regulator SMI1